jgi:hypothetical protein
MLNPSLSGGVDLGVVGFAGLGYPAVRISKRNAKKTAWKSG